MAGGKLQLLIKGNQDQVLIGSPQITFFKSIYRKHTNFSMDSLRQSSISGEPKFDKRYKIRFEPYGELLSNIYCHVTLPTLEYKEDKKNKDPSWVNGIGYAMFEEFYLNIGENIIDKQNGEWLYLNDQLSGNIDNNNSSMYYNQVLDNNQYRSMTSDITNKPLNGITALQSKQCDDDISKKCKNVSFITNFRFWFCKNLGSAIPMIAIPDLDITLTLKNRNFDQLINYDKNKPLLNNDNYSYYDNFIFYGEYIFLDNDEKRKFAQNSHKYLIEQIQIQSVDTGTTDEGYSRFDSGNVIKLPIDVKDQSYNSPYKYNQLVVPLNNINNPVKYLVWVPNMISDKTSFKLDENSNNQSGNNYFNYSIYRPTGNQISDTELYLFDTAQLFIENKERTPQIPAKFFANVFQKRYFKNVSTSNYIYVYSFSLNPNEHQPSGSCNFSKLSNISLRLNDINLYKNPDNEKKIRFNMNLYACSYNMLIIQSGNCYLEYPI